MASDVEKRLRYFNGQFLQEKDFADEQAYHIDRQRRHNRLLHTPGIAEGLDVKADKGAREAKVMPGTAVDAEGRPIVLAQERTVGFEQHFGQTVLLVISYSEEEADRATSDAKNTNTRWHEHPRVEVFSEDKAPSPDTYIQLARLVISERGTVSSEPDTSVRKGAGPRWGGEAEAGRLKLARAGVDDDQWPSLSCSAANQVEVAGNLTVTGNVGIGTAEPKSPLSVSGGAAIGSGYADKKAPDNGLLVEGNVGIGRAEPKAKLDVRGTLKAEVKIVGLALEGTKKDYVEIPEMNPKYDNGFTVEAWVRYRSTQPWSRIIDFGNGPDRDNIFLANPGTHDKEPLPTSDLVFEVHQDGSKGAVTAQGALEIGTWMHLAATVDGSGQATLYKNGQLLGTDNVPVPATRNRTKNYIGRSNWATDRYFDGKIGEVAIWNCARTEAEIKHDMSIKLTGSEPGLVGYWPCDEGAGDQVKDKAPGQHHGTIHGATWFQEGIPAITIGEYGNVGIGTAEPWALLHVAGDVMFDGRIGPHYDSDWIEVPSGAGQEIPLTHNLGVYPGLIQILTKSNHTNDGSALKDHYPDAIKVSQINSDSFEPRCPAGFGVRAITETEIILVRCGHIWHGQTNQEYFNEGWIRVFMWKFGVGALNMPS